MGKGLVNSHLTKGLASVGSGTVYGERQMRYSMWLYFHWYSAFPGPHLHASLHRVIPYQKGLLLDAVFQILMQLLKFV